MHQVFVSYANHNREYAEHVCSALENHGIGCWLAHRNIVPGTQWGTAILSAIETATVVLVIVSQQTFDSRHVIREVERADSKGKTILPLFVEDAQPRGVLEYYFGSVQSLRGDPCTPAGLLLLKNAVCQALRASRPTAVVESQSKQEVTDEDLTALGRTICWDIREEIERGTSPEDRTNVAETRHGLEVKFIDLACNRIARRSVARWASRHSCMVQLVGEDFDEAVQLVDGPPIVCCLDSLDGTQHWLRGRNLYCTALSIFTRQTAPGSPYRLRVSMIQIHDGTLFVAREDLAQTFVDGIAVPLRVPSRPVADIHRAHVCTVCRRPDHYRLLVPTLAQGSPFAGLYTFGGNPLLAELSLGHYDAVFQIDGGPLKDAQPLWDWVPGGHIACRAGCSILTAGGHALDVVEFAAQAINHGEDTPGYVVSQSHELAQAIAEWLTRATADTSENLGATLTSDHAPCASPLSSSGSRNHK